MKFILIGLIFLSLFPLRSMAQTDVGTVCVTARALDPFRGQVIPPTGEVSSGGLRFKIDKQPSVPWPQRKNLKIEGLDLGQRHLFAVIDSKGKPVESIWFNFSSFKSTSLCMFYDGYQGIGLQETNQAVWCRCK